MEGNEYDTSHLDSDALLPPRKRLLAGLKRQSSESSPDNSTSDPLSEFESRLQNLFNSCNSGSPMSLKDIAKAAGFAAVAAAMTAEAARAAAEEKAAVAAKAVAAAKNALSLVTSKKDKCSRRRNMVKKHVSIQLLYEEHKEVEGCRMDEHFARKLQQEMNSSPRISEYSPSSKSKHKKLKPSLQQEISGVQNSVPEDMDPEGSYEDSYAANVYEKGSKPSKSDQGEKTRGQPESSPSKEKLSESSDGHVHINSGRKRGRIKQKELPLVLCSLK